MIALSLLVTQAVANGGGAGNRTTFPLTEVSGLSSRIGQICTCEGKPEPNVTYPTFSSARPLYGVVRVNGDWNLRLSGTTYPFAVDESAGTGKGYDRLFIDLDRDGNFSQDKPIVPSPNPPGALLPEEDPRAQQVCFEDVTLKGDGANAGQSVRTVPRLIVTTDRDAVMYFTPPQARQGAIEIAGVPLTATLYNGLPIGTHWDRPQTGLELRPHGQATLRPTPWTWMYWLSSMPYFHGRYWRISTTPEGDRLFVEPYRGDLGKLAVGSGRKFVRDKGLRGQLLGPDMNVQVGRQVKDGRTKPVRSCTVPVGDYAPATLDISYGSLEMEISSIRHSDGESPQADMPLTYPLQIRKNKPLVLDFGDQPEVLFVAPARDARIKVGETLAINAVLVDPKLNIMVGRLRAAPEGLSPFAQIPRRIWITLALITAGPFVVWLATGANRRRHRALLVFSALGLLGLMGCVVGLRLFNALLSPRNNPDGAYQNLDPLVAIQRADGEVVASGTMPFG